MPNLYASVAELKAAMPDGVRAATTKYDPLLLRLSSFISRHIDQFCRRQFYPTLATLYLDGNSDEELRVPDLISITSVSYSQDFGLTYTALAITDYIATVGGDYNDPASYSELVMNFNGTLVVWPPGQRAIKIVGVRGYTDDRDTCWESTGDTVQNSPLTSGGTSLTTTDIDGLDQFGAIARFQAGQLLRIESEYVETTLAIDTSANTIGLVRGRNGTTAAEHAQSTAINIWRAPEPIKAACIIQAARQMERGFQGFGDARANPDIGQIFFMKQMDPEAQALLMPYRNLEIPGDD